jgi:hypothetical protein
MVTRGNLVRTREVRATRGKDIVKKTKELK